MQLYVEQLIEDMKAAAKNLPPKPYYESDETTVGIEYVLEWENNPYQKMSAIFQMEQYLFPPSDRLTDGQIALLNAAILEMWEAYHFQADYPESLPNRRLYELLREKLEEEMQYISEGCTHIEFCDYQPDACPFGKEHCWCKDHIFDDLNMEEHLAKHNKADDFLV
jgi:hypothetical protein